MKRRRNVQTLQKYGEAFLVSPPEEILRPQVKRVWLDTTPNIFLDGKIEELGKLHLPWLWNCPSTPTTATKTTPPLPDLSSTKSSELWACLCQTSASPRPSPPGSWRRRGSCCRRTRPGPPPRWPRRGSSRRSWCQRWRSRLKIECESSSSNFQIIFCVCTTWRANCASTYKRRRCQKGTNAQVKRHHIWFAC